MSPYAISAWVLAAHFVSDFVLQSDRVATGKSSSNRILTQHVTIYTAGIYILAGFGALQVLPSWAWVAVWTALNGVLHWLTDWCTSRATSWLWKRERRHDFFVMVGFDQLIHGATLLLTLDYMSR